MDLPHPKKSHPNSMIGSSNGCWTCRIRRKKCDEGHPVCGICATLFITCYYHPDKPVWMDGGVRQAEMAERLKREVREKAHLRHGEQSVFSSSNRASVTEAIGTLNGLSDDIGPCSRASRVQHSRGADCALTGQKSCESIPFGRSDTILLMFYLERVFPFLFPFYHPSSLQGGRSWILELMLSSPVVRQATLCQSSYFFSLARGDANNNEAWSTVLTQTKGAFEVLRKSLQVITNSDIREHVHGSVRMMASIMQLQRFELAALNFDNCQAHLNAAVALFRQLLDSSESVGLDQYRSKFNTVMDYLGPSSLALPLQSLEVLSAEQAAFRFSSAILIFDDIIASTVLQEQPGLYEYHHSLLCSIDRNDPLVNLEAVIGCQNWALLQIARSPRSTHGSSDVKEPKISTSWN